MRKYDKSLIEVWECKEKVYLDIKDLTAKEYVNKIREDADKILSDSHIKLKKYYCMRSSFRWFSFCEKS